MDSRYAQIDAAEKERLPRASSESDITLLDHGESKTRVRLGPLWLWILQVALLLTSLIFFAAGLVIRPSTRTYVERFSAWSMSFLPCFTSRSLYLFLCDSQGTNATHSPRR